jgi:hypothetical protein
MLTSLTTANEARPLHSAVSNTSYPESAAGTLTCQDIWDFRIGEIAD